MTARDGTFATTCWECSTRCGALVTVEDGRVTRVAPNPDHPGSKGAFCVKGIRGLPELTYHENRLLHPMRRAGERGGGTWTRITWDEALDEIADNLAAIHTEYGPEALVGAVSSAFFSRGLMISLLFRSLGSPNWMINQDLCGGCRAVSDRVTGLGIVGGEDVENTRCALVVGRNPQAADPVQWAALKRAAANGAKVVVIDPARTPAADMADLWLRPRPGTDAAIALSMIHVLITEDLYDREFVNRWCHGFDALKARAAECPPERAAELTGVAVEDIIQAARLYADGPSCFVSGHGIDAQSNGVQTFRAFHSLVAIGGNVDRRGGNWRVKRPKGYRNYLDILHDPEFRLPIETEKRAIGAKDFPLWAGPGAWQMAAHNPSVLKAILTGEPYPVRGMIVSGVNIVVTYPDPKTTIRALKSLDFLAVASQTMTPTAEFADIVLPKTTGLEEEEISLDTTAPCISFTRAVKPPEGEARSDFDIVRDLLPRLEARGALDRNFVPWQSKRDLNRYLLGENDMDFDALMDKGYAEFPHEFGNFEGQGFKSGTGKVELHAETLAGLGLDPLPAYAPPRGEQAAPELRREYPLILLTGAREKTYHHSRYRDHGWARKVSPYPALQIHPATAAAQGLAADDWVTLETPGVDGRCELRVKVTDATPEGVVRTGMGWWLPEAVGPERGATTVNINGALSYGAPWDPITGSADTRGLPCRIAPLPDGVRPMMEKTEHKEIVA